MELSNDRLVIDTSHRDEQGKQIDPEEKQAERVLDVAIPVTVGGTPGGAAGMTASQATNGQVGDQLAHPPQMTFNGTALEFATGHSHRCCLCKHYDNRAFLAWKHQMMLSPRMQDRAEVDFLRSKVLDGTVGGPSGPDGDPDVEYILNTFGVCSALTHIFKDTFVVLPDAGCPDYRTDMTLPENLRADYTNLFAPADAEAAKASVNSYDRILKAAQGAAAPRRTEKVAVNIAKYFPAK